MVLAGAGWRFYLVLTINGPDLRPQQVLAISVLMVRSLYASTFLMPCSPHVDTRSAELARSRAFLVLSV